MIKIVYTDLRHIRSVLWRSVLFTALWWVLVEGRTDGWGMGGISVILSLAASLYLMPPTKVSFSSLGCAVFFSFFLIQSVKGGFQVAIMALRPRLKLAPVIMDLPITLPPGMARVVLANTLSLLPGTLSVRIHGDQLRLHILNRHLPIMQELRATEAAIAHIWKKTP
ncbi:MAG: Na+/H+ antiporter subunit E [Methylotenera sp.]|nr:Na+/H+ antiporter subunit E [Methylotenera sp.]MDO9234304.1 Na+/H+ antiporter subunit E [Methylotenera sp.]MDO9388920.1 Na+/H+ antiporter subunit E [Methylotenera sp.]MDP2101191.1 Na+/H+ antiporter subunit E [Methylotenera sp.]MDP2280965.1 Na+/H+ antiporter subunit E [Methylotenera sp.]